LFCRRECLAQTEMRLVAFADEFFSGQIFRNSAWRYGTCTRSPRESSC